MGRPRLTWADELMLRNEMATRRKDIRYLIQRKFGDVPPEVDEEISDAATGDELTALFDRAIFAQTKDDLLPNS